MLLKNSIERMKKWLGDGETWIGVFENHALDSECVGMRFAMPFDTAQWDTAVVNKTHAPDSEWYGPGWKYILIHKSRDVDEVVDLLESD